MPPRRMLLLFRLLTSTSVDPFSFVFSILDLDPDRMLRKQLFDEICPLDHAHAVSIKIFFIPQLIHFVRICDPIHVKVIQGQSTCLVFLHDIKRRACDMSLYAQCCGNGFCQCRFPCSQIIRSMRITMPGLRLFCQFAANALVSSSLLIVMIFSSITNLV